MEKKVSSRRKFQYSISNIILVSRVSNDASQYFVLCHQSLIDLYVLCLLPMLSLVSHYFLCFLAFCFHLNSSPFPFFEQFWMCPLILLRQIQIHFNLEMFRTHPFSPTKQAYTLVKLLPSWLDVSTT